MNATFSSAEPQIPPPGAGSLPIPLPWVPPGADPQTYDIERVHRLLTSAAYFPIFNMPNPALANHANLLIPGLPLFMTSVDVNEQLHRFEIEDARSCRGIVAANRVGEPVAKVHIQWTPIPGFYVASPESTPPLWLLNPIISQRFCMLGGHLDFQDRDCSGVRAFGTGHTFPAVEGGESVLRIGAAINVLEGLGKFKGLQGAFVINGYIKPPHELGLNLMIRMMDPNGVLKANSPITPLASIPDPDPDPTAVFMIFLGEVDPSKPVELIPSPDGRGLLGSQVHELLRLVHFGFDMNTPTGLRSATQEGPIVGRIDARLHFNPLDPAPVVPIQTTDGVFTFFDAEGGTLGTVSANMIEGRALRTQVEGFPMPLFRFVGFGPVLGGTGEFQGADGMMSLNAVVSVFPRTLSNLYVFRFYDPEQRLRAVWADVAKRV